MIEQDNSPDEARFIREYVALTGASEAQGRSAFMYACDPPASAERVFSPELPEFEFLTTELLETRRQRRAAPGRGQWPANVVPGLSRAINPAAS